MKKGLDRRIIEEEAQKVLNRWVASQYSKLPSTDLINQLTSRVKNLNLMNFYYTFPTITLRLIISLLAVLGGLFIIINYGNSTIGLTTGLISFIPGAVSALRVILIPTRIRGLTKVKGSWMLGTILIDPYLEEIEMREVLFHEYFHLMPILGLTSETSTAPLFGQDREEVLAVATSKLSLIRDNKIDPGSDPNLRAGRNHARLNFELRKRFSEALIKRGLSDPQGQQSWLLITELCSSPEFQVEQVEKRITYWISMMENDEVTNEDIVRSINDLLGKGSGKTHES